MAIMIVFGIFALFWVGMTLASLTYMVFKSSKKLMYQLENHPPFWLQSYYAFLDRYHKPLLVGSVVFGIGLTFWAINDKSSSSYSCRYTESKEESHIRHIRIIRQHRKDGVERSRKIRSCNKRWRSLSRYNARNAHPYGGMQDFYDYVEDYRYTPRQDLGTVYVQLFVQENGQIEDVSVISGVNESLDKEAIRLVRSYDKGWTPALYHGQAVEQRIVLQIPF